MSFIISSEIAYHPFASKTINIDKIQTRYFPTVSARSALIFLAPINNFIGIMHSPYPCQSTCGNYSISFKIIGFKA